MPFFFFFFFFSTVAEFLIVCVNVCDGIRVKVRARVHDDTFKVLTGKLRT